MDIGTLQEEELAIFQFNRFVQSAASAYVAGKEAFGIRIRYKGAQASATVEVDASTGDILLKHGVASSEAADTTVGIPTLNGTIDVSNAAGNTFGEVAANINASENWECTLVDVLPGWSTINTLATLAATSTGLLTREGLGLILDAAETDVLYGSSTWIVPVSIGYEGLIGLVQGRLTQKLADSLTNPTQNHAPIKQVTFEKIIETVTIASGAAADTFLEVWKLATDGTASLVFGPKTTAATTVQFEYPANGLKENIVTLQPGERLIVLIKSAVAEITAANVNVQGFIRRAGYAAT
jgi:hypothetical protein